jgi:hypothetical protein
MIAGEDAEVVEQLADLKGMWRERTLDPAIDRWSL